MIEHMTTQPKKMLKKVEKRVTSDILSINFSHWSRNEARNGDLINALAHTSPISDGKFDTRRDNLTTNFIQNVLAHI
jgi:hypothetical protein